MGVLLPGERRLMLHVAFSVAASHPGLAAE